MSVYLSIYLSIYFHLTGLHMRDFGDIYFILLLLWKFVWRKTESVTVIETNVTKRHLKDSCHHWELI